MKTLILALIIGYTWATDPCYQLKFNQSSFVCACNATYCDSYGRVQDLIQPDSVLVVTSDQDSQRLAVQYVDFTSNEDSDRIQFILDETQICGFDKIICTCINDQFVHFDLGVFARKSKCQVCVFFLLEVSLETT